ncbi:MAG TPA: hypothetical protein VNJ04_11440 [Gemmatimonadaceae bacterium]|nr:hypothetical protein [Gemmatimonadaceae bacterium]
MTVDRWRPRPDRLGAVLLEARRNSDSRSANARSQIKRTDLHVAMLPREHVDEGAAKCCQCSGPELFAGNLRKAKTKRPLPIEFRKHETQCGGLILHS